MQKSLRDKPGGSGKFSFISNSEETLKRELVKMDDYPQCPFKTLDTFLTLHSITWKWKIHIHFTIEGSM